MTTALIIPSLAAPTLGPCLDAVAALQPPPRRVVVVVSGTKEPVPPFANVEFIRVDRRLGFAEAVNLGINAVIDDHPTLALLNDDATPAADWLGRLQQCMDDDPQLGSAQGTVHDPAGRVDGRGIAFDRWGLPVQIDRGLAAEPEPERARPILAASATAAIFRSEALLSTALRPGEYFDSTFGSYHEDVDLGLRLLRTGWPAIWLPGAHCRHTGSLSGGILRWRHPWWVLANRWRALAGNLRPGPILLCLPRLLRGDIRAAHTLLRGNPRVAAVAPAVAMALPALITAGWRRSSPGPRLRAIPDFPP